ncbi:hypothetical protein BDN72DRAFT_830108 [Pluteus cervinus]|uniref:Uncharacterized protein n=1 Tax=Pluteus cervinus TaxID=181527 RepID=A0ACD3BH99_9AGAR|nr:hypothetical protein BDN72DRAFT_830108 [Pluteus cervinus]
MPNSNTPNSPPESGFVPRKEFIRERATPNHFALLAIAGPNLLRFFAFPRAVISLIDTFLKQHYPYNAIREDSTQNMCEFVLTGRPWTTPKAVSTEKLLLDVMAYICRNGYLFVSTIDYGRESDDRLTIAFSKPSTTPIGSYAGTPLPGTPLVDGYPADKAKSMRCPFALSFASATLLHVISPPLHCTPAILQAVRGSWPRGVISERKVGTNCYEFKLKGYKWFQEDTFAADSLQYILSLLSILDGESFSLLTSLSLTNRSRVKDLWIFSGTSQSMVEDSTMVDSSPPSILTSSHPDIRRRRASIDPPGPGTFPHHRRLGSDFPPVSTYPSHINHQRANTEDLARQAYSNRKPVQRGHMTINEFAARAQLPSTVPSEVDNMTGVGVGTRQVSVGIPHEIWPEYHQSPQSEISPILTTSAHPGRGSRGPSTPVDQQPQVISQLLGPNAFRDSRISSSSDGSGSSRPKSAGAVGPDTDHHNRGDSPVAIQSSPVRRQPQTADESFGSSTAGDNRSIALGLGSKVLNTQALHQVGSLVESPAYKNADLAQRKSEAGVISVIDSGPMGSMPPLPTQRRPQNKERKKSSSSEKKEKVGHGWVLVNYEHKGSPPVTDTGHGTASGESHKTPFRPPESPWPTQKGSSMANRKVLSKPPPQYYEQPSPVAGNATTKPAQEAGVKRMFSLSRKNSQSGSPSGSKSKNKAPDKNQAGPGFRQKLQNVGTPEAPRNEHKRRSLD